MNEKLSEGLKKLKIELSEEQIQQLQIYCNCVLEFNKTYNLMKAENEDELFVAHVLDSLAAFHHIAKIAEKYNSPKLADIGSGGGCPGIPLATAFPQYNWTLVERMEKRCVFLESTVKKMNLKNVKIICTNADALENEMFDIEVFRAFHPFDKKILKMLKKPLKKSGTIAAYKARSEKIDAEMEQVNFMVKDWDKIKLEVPFLEDHERNLVVIKNIV